MDKKCVICGHSLDPGKKGQRGAAKFCSQRCRVMNASRKYRELNPVPSVPAGKVGAISEYRVVVDLLDKGYDVFRACSSTCSCDLALLKGNKLLRIEVTTGRYGPSGNITYAPHTNEFDVFAIVLPDKIVYSPLVETL